MNEEKLASSPDREFVAPQASDLFEADSIDPFMPTIELTPSQICNAYVEGRDVVRKPKMVDKMLEDGIRFGWFAWLFGPIYYLYRKQYLPGWIYLVVQICLSLADSLFPIPVFSIYGVTWGLVSLVSAILGIVMGFAFYPIYRHSADSAYLRWKSLESPSCNASGYLEQVGGISWLQVVLGLAVNALSMMAIASIDPVIGPWEMF